MCTQIEKEQLISEFKKKIIMGKSNILVTLITVTKDHFSVSGSCVYIIDLCAY